MLPRPLLFRVLLVVALGLVSGAGPCGGGDGSGELTYKVAGNGDFWVKVQEPEESYRVDPDTAIGLGVTFGYDGSADDQYAATVWAEVTGTALKLHEKLYVGTGWGGWPEFHELQHDASTQLVAPSLLYIVCESAGENQKIRVDLMGMVTNANMEVEFFPVTVEVTTACRGDGGTGNEDDTIAMSALEFDGEDYFQGQFVALPNGDKLYWHPDQETVPVAMDGQTSPPAPDPDLGYGEVGDVPEKAMRVERSQLQTWCDAYAANLPAGTSTLMGETCGVALGGGGGGGGRGELVDPCLAFSLAEAEAILGNPVTVYPPIDAGYFFYCAFDPAAEPTTQAVFGGEFLLERAGPDPADIREYIFSKSGGNESYVTDWTVLNDSRGVFSADLAAGSVTDMYGNVSPITQGEPDPSLGDPAILFRHRVVEGDGAAAIYTVVGQYELVLMGHSGATAPADPEPGYVASPIESSVSRAYDLIRQGYPYVLSMQPE